MVNARLNLNVGVCESKRQTERESLRSLGFSAVQAWTLIKTTLLGHEPNWPKLTLLKHTHTHTFRAKSGHKNTCISEQIVVLLQHAQVLRSAALCLVPSALADPQLVPLSVPKPHSPSWDKRWKASWEWTASVTGWPDMGLRDSWTGGLSSADRGTKRRTSLHFCVSSLVLVLFFSPVSTPTLTTAAARKTKKSCTWGKYQHQQCKRSNCKGSSCSTVCPSIRLY